MPSAYTDITFTNAPQGGITAAKLNLLIDDLSTAIGAGGGGGTGTGDMLKSVYDTNNNGQVDTCDSVSWASVSGKPSTFPPDSTAMLKSVYDTNADNVVDHSAVSDSVPWTGVTGKPATFPPDGTAMLKATYDPGNDGIVDHAALADTAPWTGISGKPGTFPPDSTAELVARKGVASGYAGLDGTTKVPMVQLPAPTSGDATTAQLVKGDDTRLTNSRTPSSTLAHQATHLDNGSDPIPVASTTRAGLSPIRPGTATTYLNGAGAYTTPVGSGDMTKAIYDTNSDNVVDHAALADAAPWTGISGKPSTFPPDATAELVARKGVASGYASLDSGVLVPVAQLPIATATVKGIVPTPPNNTTTFLRGDATFAAPSVVPDFVNQRVIFDDFLGTGGTAFTNNQYLGPVPWQVFFSGTGAGASFDDQYADTTNKAFGCFLLTAGTAVNGLSGMQAAYLYPAKGALEMGFRILANVAPTSAQNYTLQFGLMDVAGTSYVWFDARFNVSSLIRGQTATGGTPTSTATTAFAGGAFNRYKILINAAWTSVSFFINNVLLGSAITTTIPTAIKMYPGVVLLKTVGTTTSIASDVDQFYLNYQYVS